MCVCVCTRIYHATARGSIRWERRKNRASCPSQGTVNGGAVSK